MASSERHKQILKTMGIPVWTAHRAVSGEKASAKEELVQEIVEPVSDLSSLKNWQSLQNEVANCTACDLHQSRTKTVFGVGDKQATLLVVGEAPGEDEDLTGEPFVGPAGQLLNKMLFAIGFSRDEVFIANTVKCFPPDDRKPKKSEIESCSSFLLQQINLIKPAVILCVGAASAKSLLHSNETIGNLRGQVRVHAGTNIPLIATYHPAYLIRKPSEKRAVWHDLLLLKSQMTSS